MLYLILGIGCIRTAIVVLRHLDVRSPGFLLLAKLAFYAVLLFLIFQTGKGSNWARWSLVVMFIFTIPLIILPSIPLFTLYPVDGLMQAAQVLLFLIALGLLFHRSTSEWFTKAAGSTRR